MNFVICDVNVLNVTIVLICTVLECLCGEQIYVLWFIFVKICSTIAWIGK